MAYPERTPIYQAYEAIVKSIVEQKLYKEYAESEIEALIKDLQTQFKALAQKHIASKFKESK